MGAAAARRRPRHVGAAAGVVGARRGRLRGRSRGAVGPAGVCDVVRGAAQAAISRCEGVVGMTGEGRQRAGPRSAHGGRSICGALDWMAHATMCRGGLTECETRFQDSGVSMMSGPVGGSRVLWVKRKEGEFQYVSGDMGTCFMFSPWPLLFLTLLFDQSSRSRKGNLSRLSILLPLYARTRSEDLQCRDRKGTEKRKGESRRDVVVARDVLPLEPDSPYLVASVSSRETLASGCIQYTDHRNVQAVAERCSG